MSKEKVVSVRSIRAKQSGKYDLYSFFIPGNQVTKVADITRVSRDEQFNLDGFQRKPIKAHIKQIAEYLSQDSILFPNAIILALSEQVEFKKARGREPAGVANVSDIGTLNIPLREEGRRVAWIVDGQQRSMALAEAKNGDVPVPVVAFLAEDLEVQREQFILVNKAKPLPSRLINELLPEVDTHLPRDLAMRQVPSKVCTLLHKDPDSPFHELIKFESQGKKKKAVITDTAIVKSIQLSLNNPLGALAQYKSLGDEPADTQGMYDTIVQFWGVVKEVFPDAWGLPSTKSRLMHGAGIVSMGMLMDHIMPRTYGKKAPETEIRNSLKRIADRCAWTGGSWDDLGLKWNEVQNVPSHIKALASQLIKLDYEATKRKSA